MEELIRLSNDVMTAIGMGMNVLLVAIVVTSLYVIRELFKENK